MSVKKNFIYNIAYQILTMILPLITTPYIARVLGANGVGIQAYTYSIVSYFVLFVMLGVNNYGNRNVAMVRDNKEKLSKTFTSIYLLQLIISCFVLLIYIAYIMLMDNAYKFLFIIQSLYIIAAAIDINWFFFGMEKFKLTVIRNTVIKIISVLCIFIFVKTEEDIYIYCLILALSTLVSQIILWKFIPKYIEFKRVTLKDIIKHIRPNLVLFIPVIAVSIYKILGKIMLGYFSDITQVGYYENSDKIIGIPVLVIVSLGTVMLPKISNFAANGDQNQIKKYISLSMEYIVFMSLGASFGLIGIAPTLIPVFLGNEFSECIKVSSILAATIIFVAWANVIRTQYLIPKEKDIIYIKSTILGAIINIIANFILINDFGAVGAAIGTLFAEASVAIYQTIKVRKKLEINNYIRRGSFYIIPAIIMFLILKYLNRVLPVTAWAIAIQIFCGGLIYFLISLTYMIYNKNEVILNILNKFINIKKLLFIGKSNNI